MSDEPRSVYIDMSEGSKLFYQEVALSQMLYDDRFFVITGNLNKSDENPSLTVALAVNCNDLFAWGCADFEPFMVSEIESLYQAWSSGEPWAISKWCCRHRNQQPQPPIKRAMIKEGSWDQTMEALPGNTMDKEVHESLGIEYHEQEI